MLQIQHILSNKKCLKVFFCFLVIETRDLYKLNNLGNSQINNLAINNMAIITHADLFRSCFNKENSIWPNILTIVDDPDAHPYGLAMRQVHAVHGHHLIAVMYRRVPRVRADVHVMFGFSQSYVRVHDARLRVAGCK